jgi:FkbM family methyltransferase
MSGLCDRLFKSRSFRRLALRKLFKDHMPSSALAYISFASHSFFVDPRDHMIAFQLLSGQSWQRRTLDDALRLSLEAGALKRGGWFIDIGANIGTQTVYALNSGIFCGVIAIEPDPHNFELLERNIELNGIADRVHAVRRAASSRSGPALLLLDDKNFGAHRIVSESPGADAVTKQVVATTVDEILRHLGIPPSDIAMAWIDVEGHELEVLRGMQGVRDCGVPIVSEGSAGREVAAHAEIKALLTANYDSIYALDIAPEGAREAKELSRYNFGPRQSDVLFFKRFTVPRMTT